MDCEGIASLAVKEELVDARFIRRELFPVGLNDSVGLPACGCPGACFGAAACGLKSSETLIGGCLALVSRVSRRSLLGVPALELRDAPLRAVWLGRPVLRDAPCGLSGTRVTRLPVRAVWL